MSQSYAEVLAEYRQRERVPLREVGERFGMDAAARSYAVKTGAIRPVARAGLGGGYVITSDDAARIVIAAVIAAAAGLALVTVLRGITGAGLSPAALAAALPK